MHEHVNKYAKMQRKQGKPNKMVQTKQSKHKGSRACYHTKGRAKHVKKHKQG